MAAEKTKRDRHAPRFLNVQGLNPKWLLVHHLV